MSVSATTSNAVLGRPAGGFTERRFKYLLIWPAVLVLLLIGIFPLINVLVVSVQNVTMLSEDRSFHGLLNYGRLFEDSRLWEAIAHTLIFTAVALPIELVLGMLMALLFIERMWGRQIFVALLIIPTVTSPIVAGAMWRLMLDTQFGPVNQVLGWIKGGPVSITWTVDVNFVWPAILFTEVWQWTPFMFLLLLAALANVDRSQVEAAQIDGASNLRIFFRIVLPAIKPVVAIVMLIRGLDLFRLFDIVWALTKGGPGTLTETISIYAFVLGFQQFETSYTSAIAFIVVVLLSIIVIFALRRVEIAR
ncbi:MAG: carbohydrate ABC transporter permease [Alphaproteobacteria bacterium]